MSAAVVHLDQERQRRAPGYRAYFAYFAHAVNALDRAERFSLAEWRLMAYACSQMQYGQQWTNASYRILAQELGLSKQTVYRAVNKLIRLGVFYRHQQPGDWPQLYISAYIAYRGKLKALPQVRHLEDLIKAATARGEAVDVDLRQELSYVGGVPDDDEHPTLPDWLEDA